MASDLLFQTPKGVLRLTENDINMDADGGRVVFTADANDLGVDVVEGDEKLAQVTVVLNYRRDKPMEKYPITREDRARRRFTLSIREEKLTD
jgi:hypothetical protein